MEPLGHLLHRPNLHPEESEVYLASSIIAAANELFSGLEDFREQRATAIAYDHGRLIVRVTHGATAARLKIQEHELLSKLRQVLHRRFPKQPTYLSGLSVRIS